MRSHALALLLTKIIPAFVLPVILMSSQIDPNTTDLVVCVLPNNRKDRYDTIKKFVCVEKPVPSQMVIGKTISKPDLLTAVATKVAIQINCKLGGKIIRDNCFSSDKSIIMNGRLLEYMFKLQNSFSR